jgi:hypothetical protein
MIRNRGARVVRVSDGIVGVGFHQASKHQLPIDFVDTARILGVDVVLGGTKLGVKSHSGVVHKTGSRRRIGKNGVRGRSEKDFNPWNLDHGGNGVGIGLGGGFLAVDNGGIGLNGT